MRATPPRRAMAQQPVGQRADARHHPIAALRRVRARRRDDAGERRSTGFALRTTAPSHPTASGGDATESRVQAPQPGPMPRRAPGADAGTGPRLHGSRAAGGRTGRALSRTWSWWNGRWRIMAVLADRPFAPSPCLPYRVDVLSPARPSNFKYSASPERRAPQAGAGRRQRRHS